MMHVYFHPGSNPKLLKAHLIRIGKDYKCNLSTHIQGEPQDLIETFEAIWGNNWRDAGRDSERAENETT